MGTLIVRRNRAGLLATVAAALGAGIGHLGELMNR
jgi:hypothetical protein